MPKYVASVVSLIEVEALTLEEAEYKVLSIIHNESWSDFDTEMEQGYPELADAERGIM